MDSVSPKAPPIVAKPQALACPNCGGPVERRGLGYSITAVCPQCKAVLDASTPQLQILQRAEGAQSQRTPLIPLGSRGVIAGTKWELIGFQTRQDEEGDEWEEYLLFNPYKGFRYLTQFDGHWNFIRALEEVLETREHLSRYPVSYNGRVYKHFGGGPATTTFVLGEFPWRVKAGDRVNTQDYVNPPYVLSSESTGGEMTWSHGEYIAGKEVCDAFAVEGPAPPAQGTYLNQPSPYHGGIGAIWTSFVIMAGLLVGLVIFFATFSRQETVFRSSYAFASGQTAEPSFVTPDFELTGRPASLELAVNTDLGNNWTYFNFALVNEETGQGYDFGREVSFYHGSYSDGPWDEGSRNSSVMLPSVEPGKYYLRVEPEMDSGAVDYSLTLRHDVPNYTWFLIAFGLLLIPPIWYTVRARGFDAQRWMSSQHPPGHIGSGGDE
jgi:hypothetical protein